MGAWCMVPELIVIPENLLLLVLKLVFGEHFGIQKLNQFVRIVEYWNNIL